MKPRLTPPECRVEDFFDSTLARNRPNAQTQFLAKLAFLNAPLDALSLRLRGLRACGACGEPFPRTQAPLCPQCNIELLAVPSVGVPVLAGMAALPNATSGDDEVEEDIVLSANASDDRPEAEGVLPWTHWGHGRGILVALCVLGIAAFALPWLSMSVPERRLLTGIDIAQRTGITWAGFVAWVTLLPVVLSRRSVTRMQGARLAVAILGLIPVATAVALLIQASKAAETRGLLIPLRFAWQPGVFLTLTLGVAVVVVGLLYFGGWVPLRSRQPQALEGSAND